MNKKLMAHLIIFGVLVLYTFSAWSGSKKAQEEAEAKADEELADEGYITGISDERDQTADSMMKVGVPFMITMIYGGVLVVIYVLPMFVDRMSQELIGSTESVGEDPVAQAKAAVADEDYPEAIRLYREIWQEDPSDRSPMMEIVKIQREKLESPAVAVGTLEEALEGHDWEVDDAAFLLFRMIEINEEDLEDKDEVVKLLKRAVKDFPETRHAANAMHRLRELEAS